MHLRVLKICLKHQAAGAAEVFFFSWSMASLSKPQEGLHQERENVVVGQIMFTKEILLINSSLTMVLTQI
jgi:hypothetical protein